MENSKIKTMIAEIKHDILENDRSDQIITFNVDRYIDNNFRFENSAYINLPQWGCDPLFKRLVKKIIHKLIGFYIDPCIANISKFNLEMVEKINVLQEQINLYEQEIEYLKNNNLPKE
jgi:hypothetical protein